MSAKSLNGIATFDELFPTFFSRSFHFFAVRYLSHAGLVFFPIITFVSIFLSELSNLLFPFIVFNPFPYITSDITHQCNYFLLCNPTIICTEMCFILLLLCDVTLVYSKRAILYQHSTHIIERHIAKVVACLYNNIT